MQEVWKDIYFIENGITYDYRGLYQVSNLGNVKSIFRYKKQLQGHIDKDGYKKVILYKNKKAKKYFIHRLVAIMFIPNPLNKPEVNHLNGKSDNRVCSLEWTTTKENMQHAFKTGLHGVIKGEKHYKARKVNQYDLQGNLIKTWNCIMDIQRNIGLKNSNIVACCKEKKKTAGGFIWRYKD